MNYARLPIAEAFALAAFRTQAGWEVCAEGDQLWLRAADPDEQIWQSLPLTGRFTVDAAQRLVRRGQSVPVRPVPEGTWLALAHWLPLQRVASQPGGVRPPPVLLRPMRARDQEIEPGLMLLRRSDWEPWALMAPQSRLAPLRFALASDGRVCVEGTPLPPLPGEAWVRHENIALRAGLALPPVTTAAWLSALLDVPAGGLALWHDDGGSEVLPPSAFVPATRANVRASAMSFSPAA